MFIFNTQLLIIGVANWLHLIVVIIAAVAAMLAFAAATQGYFLTKSRIWETVALLLVAFTLFRPGFWWDMAFPPLTEKPAAEMEAMVADMKAGEQLRIMLKGEKMDGSEFTKTIMLPVGEGTTGAEKLNAIGIETREEEGKILVDNVVFSSPAEKAGVDFDQEILNLQVPTKRMPKQLMFIPALLLYAFVWVVQRGRRAKTLATASA